MYHICINIYSNYVREIFLSDLYFTIGADSCWVAREDCLCAIHVAYGQSTRQQIVV